MSRHKNRGFSQTSKRYNGSLKEQHQRARSRQIDHSADNHEEENSELEKGGARGNKSTSRQ